MVSNLIIYLEEVAKGRKEIYALYAAESEDPVSYAVFKDILFSFNEGIMDTIIDGGEFNMRNRLSSLCITRQERDPRNPRVDWAASAKVKQEIINEGGKPHDGTSGENWLVHYTDPFYVRWRWNKITCVVKNSSAYSFHASRGIKGNKEKLTAKLNSHDLAYLTYKKYKNHGNLQARIK
jgi:hypothetical protein